VIKSWSQGCHHWLMSTKPSAWLVSVLSRFPPGTTLADKDNWYWVRRFRIQDDHYKAHADSYPVWK
jgi:hypothetical protein